MTKSDGGGGVPRVPASPAQPSRDRPRQAFLLALASNLGVMGLTFLTGTLNARLLGPGGRGELSAIQNVASTASTLALMGLPAAVGYFSSRRPHEARSIAVTAASLCFMGAIPTIALTYLLMPALLHSQRPQVIASARIYLGLLILQPSIIIPFSGLQGLGKFRIWSLLRITPNVAAAIAILVAWALGRLTAGMVSGCYLLALIGLVPLGVGSLVANSSGPWRFDRKLVPQIIRYGLPSAIMVPAGMVNLQLDQLVMAAWFPSAMLGLYAVSVSWSSLISPVFSALGSILFPTLASVEDPQAKRVMVGRSLRSAVVLSTFFGAGLAAVTPLFVPLLFGRPFVAAIPTALILIGASVVLNLSNLCGEILRGLGAPRWPLYAQLAALPVTLILITVLLRRIGMAGAAWASLLAYLTAFAVHVVGIARCCGLGLTELLIPRRADIAQMIAHLKDVTMRRVSPGAAGTSR